MPKISGIEVLEIVRSEERTKQIPVIMVTAEAEQTLIIAAIEAGVTNYIVKPFSENTICKKVEGVLNRRCG
jgi:two-component system chemotaxis response regulator CheY